MDVPVCFHPSVGVFPLDFMGSSIGTISPLESKLAMFQCKEDKKNLRAKVKLTVRALLFKNKASNLETQKHTKLIEMHQSQITNDDLLFPKSSRFAKMYKKRESEESAACSDFD